MTFSILLSVVSSIALSSLTSVNALDNGVARLPGGLITFTALFPKLILCKKFWDTIVRLHPFSSNCADRAKRGTPTKSVRSIIRGI
jgi:hypothetical protein